MYLAPLNYDRFFKKVFADQNIATRFLEDFLDTEIKEFSYVGTRHKVTDDAAYVEFDFRCKIGDAFVIIDMQQWFKSAQVRRFYLYHNLNTALQLEHLQEPKALFEKKIQELERRKDYDFIEPVITLVWMGDDCLGFRDEDFIAYRMTPEMVGTFIRDKALWHRREIIEIMEKRAGLLTIRDNKHKGLDFLAKNRLVFMLQKNIAKSQKITKYKRWFEFAEKTKKDDNKEEDFKEYMDDEIFFEMIKRLKFSELKERDFEHMTCRNFFWEAWINYEYTRSREILEEGIEKGERIGKRAGKKTGKRIGRKEGEKIGRKKEKLDIAEQLKVNGVPLDIIIKSTGLSKEEVAALA